MTRLALSIVAASFCGGLSLGGQAFAAYLTTRTSSTQGPLEPLDHPSRPLGFLHEIGMGAAEPESERALSPVHVHAGRPFDLDGARAQLLEQQSTVGLCRMQGDTRGPGTAVVVFGNGGNVVRVAVDQPYDQTPAGACVARRFAHARVAPFDGEQGVRVRFQL